MPRYWQTIVEPSKAEIAGYPDGTVEVPLKPSADHEWSGTEWVEVLPDPAEALAAKRAGMVCSRLQGRLVLGPDTCAQIDAIAANPNTPWAMRETIQNAMEWRRTSEAMTELGYLLGYDDDQMDALFVQAMGVSV